MISVPHQCHLPVPNSVTSMTHQCLPGHINATYQCPSELPQCHLSVPVSATYQCHQCRLSVPPISAIYECCLSVPISDACQCPSVPPTSASSSVPPISAHQCSLISPHQ
ncbi:unnamed protein product, partial [Staurois parvus]